MLEESINIYFSYSDTVTHSLFFHKERTIRVLLLTLSRIELHFQNFEYREINNDILLSYEHSLSTYHFTIYLTTFPEQLSGT